MVKGGTRRMAKATREQQAQERKREQGQGGPTARPPGQEGQTGPRKRSRSANGQWRVQRTGICPGSQPLQLVGGKAHVKR